MQCTNSCGLDGGCKNPYLFYDGPENPKILIIGEAPGRDEDEKCRLFIGRSGSLLREGLSQLGFDLDTEVGFCNTCACRPPENRTPTKKEIKTCLPNLLKTIESVSSSVKMVFLMGNTPMSTLLGRSGITKAHGIPEYIEGVPYYPMYHPAYILRNEGTSIVDTFFDDMEKAGRLYDEIQGTRVKTWTHKELNSEELEKMMPEILKAEMLSFDTETNTLDMYEDKADIICLGFCFDGNNGYLIPLWHPDLEVEPVELKKRIALMKLILESKVPKIAQNGMYDIRMVDRVFGIKVNNLKHDTTLMSHLLDENSPHNLSYLTNHYNPDMAGYDDAMEAEKKKANMRMDKIPYSFIPEYCCGDAVTTYRVCRTMLPLLENDGLTDLYYDVVMPAYRSYIDIADRGLKIDINYAKWLQKEYYDKIAEMEEALYTIPLCKQWEELKGVRVNFNSSTQMRELIYDMGGAPIQIHKKTKNASLDVNAREKLLNLPVNSKYEGAIDVIKGMDELAKIRTLYKMFVNKALTWIRDDGYVHPNFLVHGTVTGRLSMTAPNGQQMPKQEPTDPWLKEHPVKRMFVSKYLDGYIVSADYSQLELRLMACISGDSLMVETYKNDGDIHATTARRMFPDYDTVDDAIRSKYRSIGKTKNFSSVYSLAEDYLEIYPGLRTYAKATEIECKKNGYVTNKFGRRRRLPNIRSFDRTEYYHAYLQACNFKIQSLGHDLLEVAVTKVEKRLAKEGLIARIILEVHDSIVVDAPNEEEAKRAALIMKEEMEDVHYSWTIVPIKVDVQYGKNLQDMDKEV